MRRACKRYLAIVPDNLIFSPPGICLLILTCLAVVYRHVNRIPEPQLRPAINHTIPLGACQLVVSGMNQSELIAAIAKFPSRFDGSLLTPIIRNRSALTFEVEFTDGICAADLLMLVSYLQFSGPRHARLLHLLVAAEATLSPDFGPIGEALEGQPAVIYIPTGADELDVIHLQTRSGIFRMALADLRSAPVIDAQIPRGLGQIVTLPVFRAA